MTGENYLKKLAEKQTQIKELVPDSLKENEESEMKYFNITFTGEHSLSEKEFMKLADDLGEVLNKTVGDEWIGSLNFDYKFDAERE